MGPGPANSVKNRYNGKIYRLSTIHVEVKGYKLDSLNKTVDVKYQTRVKVNSFFDLKVVADVDYIGDTISIEDFHEFLATVVHETEGPGGMHILDSLYSVPGIEVQESVIEEPPDPPTRNFFISAKTLPEIITKSTLKDILLPIVPTRAEKKQLKLLSVQSKKVEEIARNYDIDEDMQDENEQLDGGVEDKAEISANTVSSSELPTLAQLVKFVGKKKPGDGDKHK